MKRLLLALATFAFLCAAQAKADEPAKTADDTKATAKKSSKKAKKKAKKAKADTEKKMDNAAK